MATVRSTERTTYGDFIITITESAITTQNIVDNTTTFSVSLVYSSPKSKKDGGAYWCGVSSFTVTDKMGNELCSYSRSYGQVANITTSDQTLYSKSGLTAYHASNGTGEYTIYLRYCIGNRTYYTGLSSTTIASTTVPRASALSIDKTSLPITSSSTAGITATITPQAGGFYHILSYEFDNGGSSGKLADKVLISNTSAKTYTLTRAGILDGMPTTITDTITFTLQTYSDSACTVKVGSAQTARATVTLNDTMKPSVAVIANVSLDKSKISGYLIADGYDVAKATFKTTVVASSTGYTCTTYFLASYGTMATASTTTVGSNVIAKSNAMPSLSNINGYASGNYIIRAYAVDSRGFQSDTASTTAFTIYGYSTPFVNIAAYRVNASGSTEADPAGEYLYYKLTSNYTSINSQNSINTAIASTYIQAGSEDKVAYNTAKWLELDSASSITVKAKVTDKVSSSNETSVMIGPAAFPLDLYDNGQGIVGAAMGGVANSGQVKMYLPTNITQPSTTEVTLTVNSEGQARQATFGSTSSTNNKSIVVENKTSSVALRVIGSTHMGVYSNTAEKWLLYSANNTGLLTWFDTLQMGYGQANSNAKYIQIGQSDSTGTAGLYLYNNTKNVRFALYNDGSWSLHERSGSTITSYIVGMLTNGAKFLEITNRNRYTDADNIIPTLAGTITAGMADTTTQTNFPTASQYWQVIAISQHNTNHVKQFAIRAGSLNEVWMRSRYTNSSGQVVWGAWEQITISKGTASSVFTRTGGLNGSTCDYAILKRYGNVVTIYSKFTCATQAGTALSNRDIFTGTMNNSNYPPNDVEAFAYYGSSAIGLRITPQGAVTVRNASGGTVTIEDSIYFSVTYVL